MDIEIIKTSELIPYETNPRENMKAVDAVANSIKTFGFRQPLVIDKDNVIVVGHTRLKAAIKLGIQEVPCHRINQEITPELIKAYRIADNKVGEISTWDNNLLAIELEEIFELPEIDFISTGFSEKELFTLTEGRNKVKKQEKLAILKEGDVWVSEDESFEIKIKNISLAENLFLTKMIEDYRKLLEKNLDKKNE